MATKAPTKKKPPSPREICTVETCRHPKPFHPDSKACKAFGCRCTRFRKTPVKV